jgi:hypothetical protein
MAPEPEKGAKTSADKLLKVVFLLTIGGVIVWSAVVHLLIL